jgi:hypothetical protein
VVEEARAGRREVKMRTFYTPEDVARWEKSNEVTVAFQIEALRKPGIPPNLRWQRYGHIAGAYESMAIIAIARKNFAEVCGLLVKCIEAHFQQYDIELAEGKTVDAGYFQHVLLAYAATDKPLIAKMVDYYSWQNGIPESVYLGKIVKWLALGDISLAQDVLTQKRPRMEKMFAAYPDCFQAIANKDEAALQTAISAASKN